MSTQPCIPQGSLNRVPASAGGKGGNVTSAGWQVTPCDPMWHVSSYSSVATLRTAIHSLLTYLHAGPKFHSDRYSTKGGVSNPIRNCQFHEILQYSYPIGALFLYNFYNNFTVY